MRTLIVSALLLNLVIKSSGQCLNVTLTITPPSCASCCDGSATVEYLTGGCPPYTFIWNSGYTGPTIPEIICFDTTWTLTIIDSDTSSSCCPDTIIECRISSSTGLTDKQNKESSLYVFPNPANETLNFVYNDNDYKMLTIMIYDSKGALIYNNKFSENIDISRFPQGEYVIVLNKYNEEVFKSKWIKN